MRSALLICVSFIITACSSRTVDVEEDYTEEVERICRDLCEKVVTCVDPPLFETQEECRATCTGLDIMYEDSACGEGFRALYGCIGGTPTCEVYLDTKNVIAPDYTCKQENEALGPLKCGASEGDD